MCSEFACKGFLITFFPGEDTQIPYWALAPSALAIYDRHSDFYTPSIQNSWIRIWNEQEKPLIRRIKGDTKMEEVEIVKQYWAG